VSAQLEIERKKQMLGCAEDESCLVEIAGAFGAERLLAGSVTLLDQTYLISIKMIDVRRGRSVTRTGDTLKAPSQTELIDGVRRAVFEALTGRKLDTTGVVHIEVAEKGASVALDGQDLGTSPLPAAHRVLEGQHSIVVQKAGFVRWETVVTVAAGGTVPVSVQLVPLAELEKERRVYVEVFGGFSPGSRWGTENLGSCAGGCVGNLGGVRGGYTFAERFGIELFLVPYLFLPRASQGPVTTTVPWANNNAGAQIHATDFTSRANVGATYGGVSLSVRFFERTPLLLRLWAGAASGYIQTLAGGRFPDAPPNTTGHYDHASFSQGYWSPVFGPEVRIGYRFSRGFVADAGMAALLLQLPSSSPETGSAVQDQTVLLPPGPAFKGGTAWFFPVTVSVRWDL
jgi:hypothetical protein